MRQTIHKQKQLNTLFDRWDINCSGYILMKNIREVLKRQKEFMGTEDIELEGMKQGNEECVC